MGDDREQEGTEHMSEQLRLSVRVCVPWYRLGGGYHRDKLGTVGYLLLDFRTGSNVGPHLYQSHLRINTHSSVCTVYQPG